MASNKKSKNWKKKHTFLFFLVGGVLLAFMVVVFLKFVVFFCVWLYFCVCVFCVFLGVLVLLFVLLGVS